MGIATMADIAKIVEVNCAARSPKDRRDLFQRISERHDLEAFEILYDLYFGDTWAKAFHTQERKAMQGLVGEATIKILSDGGGNAKAAIGIMLMYEEPPPIEVLNLLLHWLSELRFGKDRELRKLTSVALLKFLPQHRDFHDLGLVIAYVNSASDVEDDPQISADIRQLLTAVKLRYEHDQAQTEPE